MLRAFFDESGKLADSDFICMCGYISDDRWDDFSEEWAKALKDHNLPFIHTSALFSHNFPYDHIEWPAQKRDAVMLDFVRPIVKYARAGFGVALDAKFFRNMPQGDRKTLGDRSPEVFIFHRLLHHVVKVLRVWSYSGSIGILFDMENGFSTKCLQALIHLRNHRSEVKSLIGSIAFCDDAVTPPIQAADMLAYATKRNLQDEPPPYYDALVRGIDGRAPPPYVSEFYDADGIKRTVAEVRRKGVISGEGA